MSDEARPTIEEAVALLTEEQRRVLRRMPVAGGVATHWLNVATGGPTARSRRVALRLQHLGLVKPFTYLTGRNYHWGLTDAGRAVAAFVSNNGAE